jgi:HAMP domain-containing protein
VTLASYVALAAILPLTVHAWAESEGQRSTERALDRYRRALETGGTDALRAMFDCHPDPQPSVAVRVMDERDVELFRASSDDASSRVAAALTEWRPLDSASHDTPAGWHVAAVSVSQGRELEVVLHDESAPRLWGQARAASLLMLACGLVFAIVGAFVITRRALRPIGDLARATQGIIDSGDLGLRVRDARNERRSRSARRALQSHARAKRGARPGHEGVARQRRTRSAHAHWRGSAPARSSPCEKARMRLSCAKRSPRPSKSRTVSSAC